MKINFNTDTINPMLDWLMARKKTGMGDVNILKEILDMPDYLIEFKRYNLKNLPVCNISVEEAIDFFMNFDNKKFTNPRLSLKQESFLKFYNSLDKNLNMLDMFTSINYSDKKEIDTILKNGLPLDIIDNELEYNIIFIVSIGNSMGWPYRNYIDFDLANMTYFKDKNTFLHVIAHEIHHTMYPNFIPDDMKPSEYFLLNFAYEGLAVHFCNNAYTINKPSKYNDSMIGIDLPCWNYYEKHFDELFLRFKKDYFKSINMNIEEVSELISNNYEQFTFKSIDGSSIEATHYPTYYLGCYFFGLIDLVYGKEALYDATRNPSKLLDLYNKALIALKIDNKYLMEE